jgi:hypothetical protein
MREAAAMSKSVCFVIMPFGKKSDAGGRTIDFEAVYDQIIAPAVEAVGFRSIRSDREAAAGIVHKAMFERLILSEYAVADLTVLNANVFYELGVRHSARPQSTVLISAETSRLPFDIAPLSAMPYGLGANGRPNKVKVDRAALKERLAACKSHRTPDSPLFTLLDGFVAPQVAHEKTDIFQREINKAEAYKQALRAARAKDVAALDAFAETLGDLAAREASLVADLFLAYRHLSAWERMIALYGEMEPVLASTATMREQYALALNRAGRGPEAEQVLLDLIARHGPSSETYGLLGRVYKDRWRRARDAGDEALARSHLKRAFEAYRKGFEADWRDAFPGVNAATLAEMLDPGGAEVRALAPVVRYAAERKIARGAADYWDHATRLEIAVLERDEARIAEVWGDVLADRDKMDGWSPKSTADNLRDIARAREAKGEDTAKLKALIARLEGALTLPAA